MQFATGQTSNGSPVCVKYAHVIITSFSTSPSPCTRFHVVVHCIYCNFFRVLMSLPVCVMCMCDCNWYECDSDLTD